MVSNCGKSETGGIDGQPGDQTKAEYWNINWYTNNWTTVFRHPNPKIRALIAEYAREAADNDQIGYGQSNRMGMWQQISFLNPDHNPKRITAPCNADCSSSTMAIIRAVGLDMHDSLMSSADVSLTTYTMLGGGMQQAGFTRLTDSKYLTSDRYLLAGDVLMNDGHVCIVITDGSASSSENGGNSNSSFKPTETVVTKPAVPMIPTMLTRLPLLQFNVVKNYSLEEVKACQALINLRGKKLEIDGIYGMETVNAVKELQKEWGIYVDGECGAECWKHLIVGQ